MMRLILLPEVTGKTKVPFTTLQKKQLLKYFAFMSQIKIVIFIQLLKVRGA